MKYNLQVEFRDLTKAKTDFVEQDLVKIMEEWGIASASFTREEVESADTETIAFERQKDL